MLNETTLKIVKKYGLTPGNILFVSLSFWATVMLTRLIIFWGVLHGAVPAIFIEGYHIHHFITGFVLLLVSLVLLSKDYFSKYIPLVIFGCGLGFIADEFLFWTRGRFDYWSLINLAAVIVLGTTIVMAYVHAKRHTVLLAQDSGMDFQPSPRMLTALLPVFLLTLILMVVFFYTNNRVFKNGQPGIQSASRQELTPRPAEK